MSSDEELAERALNYARHDLIAAGNPSWTTLLALPDGRITAGPLIVARLDIAQSQAPALETAAPDATILFVGCDRAEQHLRFTVVARDGTRLLRRDETQERPIGDKANERI